MTEVLADNPLDRPLRVLVVNQTAGVGGGEHSLLTFLTALAARDACIAVASPVGDLSARTAALGVRYLTIAGTHASFRLDVRTTPRELASLARSAVQVARLGRRLGVDVVHANTTRAGLIAIVARALGAPAPLVHVRDLTPPGRASQAVLRSVAHGAGAIVANSQPVADQFDRTVRADVRVIHDPIELADFDPARQDRSAARARLGIADGIPLAGVVGQLTPLKGQDDAIRSLAVARRSTGDARLVLAGSAKFEGAAARFDNAGFAKSLPLLARRLGLGDAVSLLGEVDDVAGMLAALDVLLVPSWQEGFGRVVVEGMAMGLPVIATTGGGPPEIIDDGRTGFLLPPRDPEAWGGLLAELLHNPARRAEVGAAARLAAMRFTPEAHADAILKAYRAVAR